MSADEATVLHSTLSCEYFDTLSGEHLASTSGSHVPYNESVSRKHKILDLLRFDHLNFEEKENIKNLVLEHSEIFHLPSEDLPLTNAAEHYIPTINNVPIHVKRYRFPPVHKQEIGNQ